MQGNGFCNVQFLRELQRDRKTAQMGDVELAILRNMSQSRINEMKKKADDDVEITGVDLSRCPAAYVYPTPFLRFCVDTNLTPADSGRARSTSSTTDPGRATWSSISPAATRPRSIPFNYITKPSPSRSVFLFFPTLSLRPIQLA